MLLMHPFFKLKDKAITGYKIHPLPYMLDIKTWNETKKFWFNCVTIDKKQCYIFQIMIQSAFSKALLKLVT